MACKYIHNHDLHGVKELLCFSNCENNSVTRSLTDAYNHDSRSVEPT